MIAKHLKSTNIEYSLMLISIILGVETLFQIRLIDVSASNKEILVGAILSFFYAFIILKILNLYKNKLYIIFISILISSYIVFNIFDIYLLYNMGYEINLSRIKMVFDSGLNEFLSQSGVEFETALIIIVTFFISLFTSTIIVYFLYTRVLASFKFYFFIPISLIFIILDIVVGSYKTFNYPKTIFNTYNIAIKHRPVISFGVDKFYYLIDSNSLKESSIEITKKGKDLPNIVIFIAESIRNDILMIKNSLYT